MYVENIDRGAIQSVRTYVDGWSGPSIKVKVKSAHGRR